MCFWRCLTCKKEYYQRGDIGPIGECRCLYQFWEVVADCWNLESYWIDRWSGGVPA